MKGCVFCKIVAGELPCYKLYEDEKVLAFLDIHPVNPGHTLVIPKNPDTRNIFDIPKEDWLAMTAAVHHLSRAIEEAVHADGINIVMNNREHANQVVDHPHIHIIPRFKGDGHKGWPHSDYEDGEAEAVQEKILQSL